MPLSAAQRRLHERDMALRSPSVYEDTPQRRARDARNRRAARAARQPAWAQSHDPYCGLKY